MLVITVAFCNICTMFLLTLPQYHTKHSNILFEHNGNIIIIAWQHFKSWMYEWWLSKPKHERYQIETITIRLVLLYNITHLTLMSVCSVCVYLYVISVTVSGNIEFLLSMTSINTWYHFSHLRVSILECYFKKNFLEYVLQMGTMCYDRIPILIKKSLHKIKTKSFTKLTHLHEA